MERGRVRKGMVGVERGRVRKGMVGVSGKG